MSRCRWVAWALLLILVVTPFCELAGHAVHRLPAGKFHQSHGPLRYPPGIVASVPVVPALAPIGSVPTGTRASSPSAALREPFVPPRA